MKTYSLLIGNDINNLVPDNSWKDLLNDIVKFCGAEKLVTNYNNKPFPLLYEEIFLKSLRQADRDERELKKFISSKVSKISANEIHERINALPVKDIITTNYEFTLESSVPGSNSGITDERLYSIFRHYEANGKRYWHVHGDCRNPNSINLGFEHYGGQLQLIRNFVVTGTNYTTKAISKLPLIRRLEDNKLYGHSWIELFFTTDIYIAGLSLDFVETDLWWLLTYRARQKFYRKHPAVKNNIFYFIPSEFAAKSKEKTDLMHATGITVIDHLSGADKKAYYHSVLDIIEKGPKAP